MDQYSFPSYLGFGKLSEQSIYHSNDFYAADYYFLNEKVHTVKVFENRTEFANELHGERGTVTFHRDLK